jgi:hypothetical protein
MPEGFAKTPEPPYYAVIFTSQRRPEDEGYAAMAEKMHALALALAWHNGRLFRRRNIRPRVEAERPASRRAAPRQGELVFALSGAGRPGRKGLFRAAGALRWGVRLACLRETRHRFAE